MACRPASTRPLATSMPSFAMASASAARLSQTATTWSDSSWSDAGATQATVPTSDESIHPAARPCVSAAFRRAPLVLAAPYQAFLRFV